MKHVIREQLASSVQVCVVMHAGYKIFVSWRVGWNHQQAPPPLVIPPKFATMFVHETIFEMVETAARVPPYVDMIFECGLRKK